MDFQEKVEKFKETAASRDARIAHAQAVGEMVKEVLPRESTVRNIYTVEVLPEGAVAVYTPDIPEVSAWILPKMGERPINLIGLEEITVPTFEITGDVSYKIRDARNGRINVAERSMLRLKDSIVAQEEESGWALIKAACTAANTVTGSLTEGITKANISDAVAKMRSNRGFNPVVLYMNAVRAGDIRKWDNTVLDPVSMREVIQEGGLGSLWRIELREYSELADNEAYLFDTSPGKLGYMPIANELQTFDDPTQIPKFRIGIIAYEEVGFGIIDSRAVVKIALT